MAREKFELKVHEKTKRSRGYWIEFGVKMNFWQNFERGFKFYEKLGKIMNIQLYKNSKSHKNIANGRKCIQYTYII